MATTLKIVSTLTIEVDGATAHSLYSATKEATLAAAKHLVAKNQVIADNYGIDALWAAGGGGMDSYSHGLLVSDEDVWVELKAGSMRVLLQAKANIPLAIPGKVGAATAAILDGAQLVDGTDYDDVDTITVGNDTADGTGDATVELYLIN